MLTDLIEGAGIGLILIGIGYVYIAITKWPKRERKAEAAPAAGDIYYVPDCSNLGTHHSHTDASHCDGGHSDGGSCGH